MPAKENCRGCGKLFRPYQAIEYYSPFCSVGCEWDFKDDKCKLCEHDHVEDLCVICKSPVIKDKE